MKRLALTLLPLLSALLLVTLLVGGSTLALLFGSVAMLFPVLLMGLGEPPLAGPSRTLFRRVGVVLAVLLQVAFWGLWALAGRADLGGRFAGFPAVLWLLFFAIWLLPLMLTSWAYARSFPGEGE